MYPIDLHVHTTASDGKHPPSEIVRMAGEGRMKVVAITDHDTVNGLPEAIAEARKFPSLTVIPGVEISTDVPAGEVHVLGYFVNYADGDDLHSSFTRHPHNLRWGMLAVRGGRVDVEVYRIH